MWHSGYLANARTQPDIVLASASAVLLLPRCRRRPRRCSCGIVGARCEAARALAEHRAGGASCTGATAALSLTAAGDMLVTGGISKVVELWMLPATTPEPATSRNHNSKISDISGDGAWGKEEIPSKH